MTDEMFMKLLEMVGQAGEGGFALAIIYLVYEYFSITVIWGSLLLAVWWFIRLVRHLNGEDDFFRNLAEQLNASYNGEINRRDKDEIIRKLKQLKQKNRELKARIEPTT